MVDFIQMRHTPGSGKEHDDTFSAEYYDRLQEIHIRSSGNFGERLSGPDTATIPTFYFYVAGGSVLP